MQSLLLLPFKQFVTLSSFSAKLVEKCCGGNRVIDALFHLPSSLSFRSGNVSNFSGKLTVIVQIIEHVPPRTRGGPYKIIGKTSDGILITIIYFHFVAGYLKKTFPIGGRFTVSGDAQRRVDEIVIMHPDIITSPSLFGCYVGAEAVYPLTAKLSNKTMRYVVNSLLKIVPTVPEWIPNANDYGLLSFNDALRKAHNPQSVEDLSPTTPARFRLALDELLANQIQLKKLRNSVKSHIAPIFSPTNAFLDQLHLPFELTADQNKCLQEIMSDFSSRRPMNRLIQGDVGSGKTVVAFFAMLIVLENHAQVAFLAPTEILALQHYNTLLALGKDIDITIDFMASQNRKHRLVQIDRLQSGETQILVGTHAILEENITFKNLGLVVIDEQHRFGVLQRLSLIEKTHYPNVLSMSATPIPRTMLLGAYGDLDVSTIKTKPAQRKPITTSVIGIGKIDELISRLQEYKSQVYWVCPVIEESETLTTVYARCDYLRRTFPENEVQVLHGKMNTTEKESVMQRFRNNEFKILVSTVVIEVGVDIPNANMIIIEHAERFGLAQLHQLRGRVGRGDVAAYCVLLYHTPVSAVGKKRLQIMKETPDGFLISEEDLQLRGAGDILGRDQSGFSTLKFSDFASNSAIIEMASEIVGNIPIDNGGIELLIALFARIDDNVVA